MGFLGLVLWALGLRGEVSKLLSGAKSHDRAAELGIQGSWSGADLIVASRKTRQQRRDRAT